MTTATDQGTVPDAEEGFFISVFSAFGDFEGKGWWGYEKLSEKWTALCRDLLVNLGEVFDYQWSDQLSHVRTKLTSAQGVGVCTIFIKDQVVSSMLLMAGKNEAAEQDAVSMYVSSLRDTVPSSMLKQVDGTFSEVASIAERPLMVVVPFPNNEVSEQDQDIVRELSWHFAAAFFQEQR
jgi:hypothetical protein